MPLRSDAYLYVLPIFLLSETCLIVYGQPAIFSALPVRQGGQMWTIALSNNQRENYKML